MLANVFSIEICTVETETASASSMFNDKLRFDLHGLH